MRVTARKYVAVVFILLLWTSNLHSQLAPSHAGTAGTDVLGGLPSAQRRTVPRIIAKLSSTFATKVEGALPLDSMRLAPGESGDPDIETFLRQHSVHNLAPVYPALVRIKKQRHISDLQIASELRQRFARRANRMRSGFNPPEISRTYVLDVSGVSEDGKSARLTRLKADPNVEWAETDHVSFANLTPNDPYFSSYGSWGQPYDDLWGIKTIGAPSAWNTNAGDGVVVAVVDTGIDLTHPDIVNNLWTNTDGTHGWDFIGCCYSNPTQSNNPVDGFGHGTHVAGTIAATGNNGLGVIGVAWHAQVMAVKGLDDDGYGLDSTLAPAITYAADHGADIISNSWGGEGSSQAIADAVNYAYSLGAVIVAAAGNNNEDAEKFSPANLPQVITVGAIDPNQALASFSNWGSKIDVVAPGVDILSLRAAGTTMGAPVGDSYIRANGTSMATPHVSGTAALILSEHPEYSNEDVRQVLRVSATQLGTAGFDMNYGYGLINDSAALSLTNVLEARISGPAAGIHIKSPTALSGVARGSGFVYYTLEYGLGTTPTSWTLFQTSSTAISGTLGTFDPSTLPDGIYTIRLTVYDSSNHAFIDRLSVVVDYVTINSPVPPQVPVTAAVIKPGVVVPITGTATGASFQDFHLEWAEGINPGSGWSAAGVTLVGGGTAPITNSTVGSWDTSSITKADYYTIRLTVDNATYASQAITLVYLEPDLLSANWPQWLDLAPGLFSGLVPATDASGNVHLALAPALWLGGSGTATFRTFSADGSSQTGVNLQGSPSMYQPAAGDLNGKAGQEVAFGESSWFDIFGLDNTYTQLSPPTTLNFQYAQPVLQDLDGDSELETLVMGHDYTTSNDYLFAWRSDGQQLNSNFPTPITDQNSWVRIYTPQRILVGDLHGDGNKEILAVEGTTASTSTLRLFASDGTPQTWAALSFNGYPASIALADLDHNGQLETIVAVISQSSGVTSTLHVLQPDGTERPGWPVAVQNLYPFTGVVVGDLARDGREEIVVPAYNQLFVFNADGTLFSSAWPQNNYFGNAVLADIDGDGYPEILTTVAGVNSLSAPLPTSTAGSGPIVTPTSAPGALPTVQVQSDGSRAIHVESVPSAQDYFGQLTYREARLVALRRDGTIARSWNLLGANGNQPWYLTQPVVGDFNHDGITDIAVSYMTIEGGGTGGWLIEGVATVLSTGAPFNPAVNDWPMLNHDPRNTAVLGRDATAAPPTFSPTGGKYGTPQAVTLSDTTAGASIHYTTDGSSPTVSSTLYTAPIAVSTNTAIKAIAIAPGFSASSVVSQTYIFDGTSTLQLVSSANPSVIGQSVTFTATVSPASATGSVIFKDGSTAIGTSTLTSGIATLTTSVLALGSHTISASYGGDSNFSSSNTFLAGNPQVVNKDTASVTLVSTPNPSPALQSVSFTATVSAVAPATGTPTGTITIFDGGTAITTAALTSDGVAHFDISFAAGRHTMAAGYSGDSTFSAGNGSLTGNPQVITGSSRLTLISSPNPSLSGQAVTFTATVSPVGVAVDTPTGSVTFYDGTNAIGTRSMSSGVATLTTSALAVGSHTITATYGGDIVYTGSTGSLSKLQVVNKGSTAIELVSSLNPSAFGQPVTFTSTISAQAPAAGTPTGAVTFRDGSSTIGTAALTSGTATITTSALAVGNHTISASYSGDSSYTGSSASLGNAQVVNKRSTTLAVISSANPTVFGQAVTFTATISPTAAPGSITFRDGSNILGTATLSSGVARFVTSALILGSHTITASYAGNSQYFPDTASLTGNPQVVNKGNSSVNVVSSVNPSIVGQLVKFTAKVSAAPPATGTPTGTVTFVNADTGIALSSATLSGGVAYYSASALTIGTHNISVSYPGDNHFTGGTGSLTQVVNLDGSSVTLTASLNPSVTGQPVKFTIAVKTVSPATGIPTGTVTLFDNGNAIGSASLTSGIAYITTNTLAVGSHAMTASYGGDNKFAGSTGRMSTSETVKQGSTSMTLKSSQNPSLLGQAVSFTATVTAVWPATGTPTGTVSFLDGTNAIGSGTLSGGVASFTTSALIPGSHTITASYGGDTNFNSKTASMSGNPQLVK